MIPGVVVVGSLNMDFVVSTPHLPAPGETVLGHGFQMIPGGKGANQAYAAARLSRGAPVRMIGRVGYDAFADHLKASLSAAGVDVSFVHSTRAAPTGIAMIAVDGAGQNSIVVAPGANSELLPADVGAMRRVFHGNRVAAFQLETPIATVEGAMRVAREEGLTTILDPAPARPLPAAVLAATGILTPNESEARTLLGEAPSEIALADAPSIAARLRDLGVAAIVLKLGSQGCWLSAEGIERHFPAVPVKPVDSTAAGDTFNAALAVALAEGQPWDQALPFANAAAAFSVTKMGAQSSAPSRDEAEALLAASR